MGAFGELPHRVTRKRTTPTPTDVNTDFSTLSETSAGTVDAYSVSDAQSTPPYYVTDTTKVYLPTGEKSTPTRLPDIPLTTTPVMGLYGFVPYKTSKKTGGTTIAPGLNIK